MRFLKTVKALSGRADRCFQREQDYARFMEAKFIAMGKMEVWAIGYRGCIKTRRARSGSERERGYGDGNPALRNSINNRASRAVSERRLKTAPARSCFQRVTGSDNS